MSEKNRISRILSFFKNYPKFSWGILFVLGLIVFLFLFVPARVNVEFVLDSTGAMQGVFGDSTKWSAAKTLIRSELLRRSEGDKVAIRLFGGPCREKALDPAKESRLIEGGFQSASPDFKERLLAALAKTSPDSVKERTTAISGILSGLDDLNSRAESDTKWGWIRRRLTNIENLAQGSPRYKLIAILGSIDFCKLTGPGSIEDKLKSINNRIELTQYVALDVPHRKDLRNDLRDLAAATGAYAYFAENMKQFKMVIEKESKANAFFDAKNAFDDYEPYADSLFRIVWKEQEFPEAARYLGKISLEKWRDSDRQDSVFFDETEKWYLKAYEAYELDEQDTHAIRVDIKELYIEGGRFEQALKWIENQFHNNEERIRYVAVVDSLRRSVRK